MRKGFVWTALVSLFAICSMAVPALAAEKGLARADKAFVKSAAGGGMMEVQMGELATKNAASQEVKDFGQRMVTDHGKANDELKTIAAAKDVKLPTELKGKQKEKVDKFSKLTGAEFDKKYMQAMVKDHVKDIAKFNKAIKNVKDPEINAWATKTLPTLEQHLQQAKELAQKVGAEVK
ncbi:MAG: DUF305 domain-containing protein [Geobacteraceae bacterium GWC2_58_44]|nr:MAG: DUF305 domain-containing protein [Geobacteraceae bacterium GWC2_58_44]HBG06952.1 DUF305 domain-containing protein [Geobacter sp.]